MKIFNILALCIFTIVLFSQSGLAAENQEWSSQTNGLSAKLTFEIEESTTDSQIIHPKLNLRNETNAPIHMFWCIYEAGEFGITDIQGTPVNKSHPPRSGPAGAKVITIQVGEETKLDAFDFGYGISIETNIYSFNTSSLQAELKSGYYLVNYRLNYDIENLTKYLARYKWIDAEIGTLWIGEIILKDIPLVLK